MIISVLSQKGGVGKSATARTLAVAYALNNFTCKIGDLDIKQSSCYSWQQRRLLNNIQPTISVESFGSIRHAIQQINNYDCFIFDSAPHATKTSIEAAKISDLIIIPSGFSVDDLEPCVILARELIAEGIDKKKIKILFSKAGDSEIELKNSREYLDKANLEYFQNVIYEKTAYRSALDVGKSLIEVSFKTLKNKAENTFQEIINSLYN